MPRASQIRIPEREFLQLHAAAKWLCAADRNQFLSAVADALAGQAIGPGSTCRAVYAAFAAYYRPIEVEEPPAPLRKLSRGERKLEKHYAALEANRTRRERSDVR
jgi:hypothetical protein